jgi:hypothetical protein
LEEAQTMITKLNEEIESLTNSLKEESKVKANIELEMNE